MTTLLDRAREVLGDRLIDAAETSGESSVTIDRTNALECLTALRDDPELHLNVLMDLTAVDHLDRELRFELVYQLASIETETRANEPSHLRHRLRVKCGVEGDDPRIASAVPVWGAAGWMEREVFDLYGVRFDEHPDLRRVLLYDEFEGHPLRKDYPKTARQPLIGRGR